MSEASFASAVLEAACPLPDGLVDPLGRPAPRRFSVYRNNVVVGLTRALEEGFPALRKLVGDEFFAAMAREFLRAHPPRTPVLMFYGAEFPEFLEAFSPVAHLPYLADVARLEQALRESYHAADAAALAAGDLARIGLEGLFARRLRLAPSARLVRSAWPVVSIWRANMRGGPVPQLLSGAGGEAALILRPDFDPEPHPLSPAAGEAVAALIAGQPLAEALSPLDEAEAAQVLSLLLSHHAITEALP